MGSMCQYTCNKNTLSCSSSGAPACGVWTFESNSTEGWDMLPGSTPATPRASTTFAVDGTHSLAIPYSVTTSTAFIKVGVFLCPSGSPIQVIGKTFHVLVRLEVTSGSTTGDAYLALYDGASSIAGWSDWTAVSGAGWTTVDGGISEGLIGTEGVTQIVVAMNISAPSSGTIYIDQVSLQ